MKTAIKPAPIPIYRTIRSRLSPRLSSIPSLIGTVPVACGLCILLGAGPIRAGDPTPGAPAPGTPAAGNNAAAQTAKNDAPRIVFPTTTKSASDIPGGEAVNFAFDVRNEGKQELKITAVQPSCGCTIASFDPTIAPGGNGVIKAVVHTQPLWGKVSKTLSVYSNDPQSPMVVLTLNADVIPAFTVTPKEVITVPYNDPKPITRDFDIESHRKEPMKAAPPAISGPTTVKLTLDPRNPQIYHVSMTVTPPESGGDAVGSAEIDTGLAGVPIVRLSLVALGQQGVTTSPGQVDMGLVASSGPASGTISLFSRKSTFHITSVDSDDPILKIRYTKLPSELSWYNLVVTYPGGWKRGLHKGFLTVHTDLQAFPVVKVPYWIAIQ